MPATCVQGPRRLLKMVVKGLPEQTSPARLFYEFPQALKVEALYHKKSGTRTSVVVTFDGARPPASKTSASLGATTPNASHPVLLGSPSGGSLLP